jgi:hypothetical protein
LTPPSATVAVRTKSGLVSNAVDALAVDSRAWGISLRTALAIAAGPIVGGFLLVATMHWNGLFAWLIAENSLIEDAQVVELLGAAVLFGWIGIHFLRGHRRILALAYVAIAVWALLVAGEEISWGQNFGFEVSRSLERRSFQGSSDLHTGAVHGPSVYGFILISAYGLFVPFVSLRLPKHRTSVVRLLVPPLAVVPAFFIPFAYRIIRATLDPVEHVPRYAFPIVRFAEWGELTLYFGFLVVGVLTVRLIRAAGAPSRIATPPAEPEARPAAHRSA